MVQKVRHFNCPGAHNLWQPKEKSKKYIPKPERLRILALGGTAGGRAVCSVCGMGYEADYCGLVRSPKMFGEPVWACRWCIQEKGLTRI